MNLLYQRIGGHEGISRLLRHFYADVRQDPLIGPIFNAQIKDWNHHLRNHSKLLGNTYWRAKHLCQANATETLATRLAERRFRSLAFSLAGELSCSTTQGRRERNDRLG